MLWEISKQNTIPNLSRVDLANENSDPEKILSKQKLNFRSRGDFKNVDVNVKF